MSESSELKACPNCGRPGERVFGDWANVKCDCGLNCDWEIWNSLPRRTDPCPRCKELAAKLEDLSDVAKWMDACHEAEGKLAASEARLKEAVEALKILEASQDFLPMQENMKLVKQTLARLRG